ncbi:hypothetical protein [Horticoccus sp. 23ND18S-11]|uniref:hypothetical protein n=1 Tax=Horticoccus sp. 23ND18S-11 TaxID=3391832 RepID=UPI0039C9E389
MKTTASLQPKTGTEYDTEQVAWAFGRLLDFSDSLSDALAFWEGQNGSNGTTLAAREGLACLQDFAAICEATNRHRRRAEPIAIRAMVAEAFAEHAKAERKRTPAEIRTDGVTDRAFRRTKRR